MTEPHSTTDPAAQDLAEDWAGLSVCVVGAGYMGAGIGQVLAGAGAHVALVDSEAAYARARTDATIRQAADFEQVGLLAVGTASRVATRLTAASSLAAGVSGCDLVIEAVPEDVQLKQSVLREIEAAATTATVIATNTSAIPISMLANAIRMRARFLGVHWFNPPQFVPGIEVIPGTETDPRLAQTLCALLGRLGKVPTIVQDTPGFVCNRLQFALFREAAAMVEEGVSRPEDIDAVVRTSFGYRLPIYGPFMVADMAGLDVYAAAFETLAAAFGPRFACPPSLAAKVAEGSLGAKTGRGFTAAGSGWTDEDAMRRNRAYYRLGEVINSLSSAEPAHPPIAPH